MPILILLSHRLPLEIEYHFKHHQFVPRLTEGTFNMSWPDYILETTENKSLKGTGGIIGFTMKSSALSR